MFTSRTYRVGVLSSAARVMSPRPTVVVYPAGKHSESTRSDSISPPPFHLFLACFLFPFSCTWPSPAFKIEQCTPLGPASQKFVFCKCRCLLSLEGVLFLFLCLVHTCKCGHSSLFYNRLRPDHTLG